MNYPAGQVPLEPPAAESPVKVPRRRRTVVRRAAIAGMFAMLGAAVYLTARVGFPAEVSGVVAGTCVLVVMMLGAVIRNAHTDARATAAALTELRDAHESLQRSEERNRILAELGAVLSPLRYESSLGDVARVVARSLADLVIFYVVQPEGDLHRVAVAARDPAQAWIPDAVMTSLRATVHADHPARQVVRERKAAITQFAPESLEAVAEDLRALRAMRIGSTMIVPLDLGDTCHGALALASSGHAYAEADLPLALEVGRRCALFIESARRHRSERSAIQARDEALALVAHDLRNPLANVMLHLALLRRPPGSPERRSMEMVEEAEDAARRMSRILQDLLDVTKLESGRLHLDRAPVSPAEVVAEAARSQRDQVHSQALSLRTEVAANLPDVWADESRLLQVLENLIGNATKFTRTGTISVGAKAGPGEVVFWVADTGVGIAAQDIPHVFDRFWQGRRSPHGGAGLGLAIVREIVQAHRGRLWVESKLGSGSTFFFALPTTAP